MPRVGANQAYVAALQAAGADVLLIPPGTDPGVVARLQGVLLPGGEDVAPRFYGERPQPELGPVDEQRDELELGVARLSAERGLPLLGICRGHQVLNVALGGSLLQHVEGHTWEGRPRDQPSHEISVEAGSHLERLVGATRLAVNSGHHQAVREVAPGLNVSAVSDDGLVEALESADGRLLSVQCHPEELAGGQEWARRLFKGFVSRAAGA